MRPRLGPGRTGRAVTPGRSWRVLAAIAVGGAAGSLARWGLASAFPSAPGGFPWVTLTVNISGCLLIGVLMGVIADAGRRHGAPRVPALARPLIGIGFLGGFTTFSTYAVEVQRAVVAGRTGSAMAYLVATSVGALLAVGAGLRAGRSLVRLGRSSPRGHGRRRPADGDPDARADSRADGPAGREDARRPAGRSAGRTGGPTPPPVGEETEASG